MSQPPTSDLAGRLDAILWNPAATNQAVTALCAHARQHHLRAVCVLSGRVAGAVAQLEDSPVQTVALVGFPLGAMDADAKRYETELAFDLGAQEVEVVLSLGQIKDAEPARILRELRDLVAATEERPLGVSLEVARLTRDELSWIIPVIQEAGVRRMVTSTDFWPDATITPELMQTLRESDEGKLQLKAVGGIRDRAAAVALLAGGAALVGSLQAPAVLA
jgi:deoxyribose-phosphate aldolase